MNDPMLFALLPALLVLAAFALAQEAMRSRRRDFVGRLRLIAGHNPPADTERPERRRARPSGGWRLHVVAVATGVALGAFALYLAGPVGLVAGSGAGVALPHAYRRRGREREAQALERQLAECAEATSLAARSGLSIVQSLAFASTHLEPPLAPILEHFRYELDLGVPFESAVQHLADSVSTEDARLFALVLVIQARAGGNVAPALQEVAATIRHRIAVRRELRALSAQGRISGAILGSLPIAFFFVLALSSRSELAPVYRSSAGVAMLSTGLGLQAAAYAWIRRLLRVEV